MPNLIRLDWDSNFFEINVSRFEGTIESVKDIGQVEEEIINTKSDLTYWFTPEPKARDLDPSGSVEFLDVGTQVIYVKTVSTKEDTEPIEDRCNWTLDSGDLISLSQEAGAHSRFRRDKYIKEGKFKDLYSLWIENSVKSDLAEEVFVHRAAERVIAMITLAEKRGRANIGLVAVSPKFQGKGLGKLLMQTAEHWAIEKGLEEIEVVTQGDNESACKFYESLGYKLEKKRFVYHLWRQK